MYIFQKAFALCLLLCFSSLYGQTVAPVGTFLASRVVSEKGMLYKQYNEKQTELARVFEFVEQLDERAVVEKRVVTEPESVIPPSADEATIQKKYSFALRTNLLQWATLTPNLGIEWRISPHTGIIVDGSWTSWSHNEGDQRYALWKVSPEVRYYMGKRQRGFLGAMYHIGEFNYKLGAVGKQGNYQGGGVTGGYQLPLNRFLSLDFHAGVGYTRLEYAQYRLIDQVRVRQTNNIKNHWGINQLGITLVWKLVK